jgi:hypothetical protein
LSFTRVAFEEWMGTAKSRGNDRHGPGGPLPELAFQPARDLQLRTENKNLPSGSSGKYRADR